MHIEHLMRKQNISEYFIEKIITAANTYRSTAMLLDKWADEVGHDDYEASDETLILIKKDVWDHNKNKALLKRALSTQELKDEMEDWDVTIHDGLEEYPWH